MRGPRSLPSPRCRLGIAPAPGAGAQTAAPQGPPSAPSTAARWRGEAGRARRRLRPEPQPCQEPPDRPRLDHGPDEATATAPGGTAAGLPAFVTREFEASLRCGILAHG